MCCRLTGFWSSVNEQYRQRNQYDRLSPRLPAVWGRNLGGDWLTHDNPKVSTTDKVRQTFALTERDEATGLDHTWFRKYESFAGRWTSPDPYPGGTAESSDFNRYSYVNNDPTNLTDPSGLMPKKCDGLTVTDPATGRSYCLPVLDESVKVPFDVTAYLFVLNSGFSGFGGIGVGGATL